MDREKEGEQEIMSCLPRFSASFELFKVSQVQSLMHKYGQILQIVNFRKLILIKQNRILKTSIDRMANLILKDKKIPYLDQILVNIHWTDWLWLIIHYLVQCLAHVFITCWMLSCKI